ncbi:S-layer homology domain-containing protein [Brevibacillus sp. MS2.2]|uniref:S-layer homology domain-containing protein n=1 Tax=Brevibacillus sp. MS2.2 TaxID=2738981 RepID=UPI00156BCE5B|nr:S-layer homology domain-containing protein [Brevibacillus sp. MS2.2]NRR22890.1 FIVAR domain-containing protein [Brevibacillus sp. MS2.2]
MNTSTKRRNWWRRSLAFMLLLTLVASSFSMPGVPGRVQAAEAIKWLTYKFDMKDFANTDQQALFKVNGNAHWGTGEDAGKMVLTDNIKAQQGSVFNRVGINPNENMSFSTGFSFEINASSSGDGMTFAIVSDPENLGAQGGFLGIGGPWDGKGPVKPSVAVKFDTYQNGSGWGDPSNNYIGIAVDGDVYNYPNDPVKQTWFKDLNGTGHVLSNGKTYYTWIDYDGSAETLTVYFSDTATKPEAPFITGNGINLKQAFAGKDKIYAGFTAATGGAAESHKVLSWYFVNDLAPIGSDFGNPDTSSEYKQAPSSLNMEVGSKVNGAYPIVITAKDATGQNAVEVPVALTSSQAGTWKDATGNPITDWSTVKTDSEGKVTVYYIPDNASVESSLSAVAIGGATATGTVSAIATSTSPGGVSEGLLSWVDVEQSAVLSGKQINQLTDLADGGAWMPNGATSNDNVPNALNFNSGIQIDSNKGYYTRSSIDFNHNATTDREIFSVQASDRYSGFPWEFGGKYIAPVVYGGNNGKSISANFSRDEGILSADVGDYQLKNGAMLNIWSAPNDWVLSLNGKVLQTTNSNTPNFVSPITSGSKPYYFGAGHNSRFYGKMSETILYNRKLTDEDRNKVNSYLALKYGLTLKDDNNAPIDYVASDGSTMWAASNNTGYANRITGIGRDEVGALYQKQSKSQVDGANVTLAIGNAIEETNAQNTKTIAQDKSFFVFSDNGGDVTFVTPITKDTESLKRIGRTYKVEKTNWQDTDITLHVDKVEGASEWPLYLVVSEDEQFDQNDAFHPLTDGTVTLNSAEFAHGNYFTVAATVPVPTDATIEQTVADGNKLTVTFDRGVALTNLTGFTITVDGTPVENGGLTFKVDENDATKLVITLSAGTDVSNKAVNISYDGLGNLKGTNGAPVDPFNKNVDSGATLTITEPSANPVTVTKPEIKGTAEAGSTIKVVIKNQGQEVEVSGDIILDENGNWTFTPTQDLKDGEYTIEVTATTVDGKSAKATKSITVVTAPTEPVVDKSKLQAKADEIQSENLKADDYTTESWEELQKALQKADAVLADPNATQQEVDEALLALTKAREGLKKPSVPMPTVDKSKLQAKADEIQSENLKADDYTSESWEELQKALKKADAVLVDPNATQEEVDEALSVLTKAREGLKKPSEPTPTVDKSKLQAKADEIKSENLKADDYTSESWEELQKALKKADTVLADPNATQDEVDEALSALTKARKGLKKPSVPTPTPTVDKSKLQAKADEIQSESLEGEDYTSESWEELQKALRKADAILADPNATQEEVDKALSALKKAREGLKKPDEPTPTPTVDKSKLQARVDEIDDEDLDEDDYTSSSWRKLEKALKRANDVLDDPDATQDEVDEALAELKKARRGLESVDKRDRDREKERKKDRDGTNQVQNPFFTGGNSGNVAPKPSEPAKEENDQTGYMNGYPTGNFDPNRQVTRAEMAMILVNTGMVKTTSASGMFMDVADQHWAADAIRRANAAGLMNGYSNGTFNPGGGITRAEMATIVYKHLGLNGDGMPNNFYDVPADHWATQIIAAVSKEGYMSGYPDGTFHPQNTLTRAETVTIINRLLNHSQLSSVIGQSWPDVPSTHWAYKDIEAATKK